MNQKGHISMSKSDQSAWDELREGWHYNTPIYQMSGRANAMYFAILLAFIAFFVVIPIVFF